MQHSMQLGSGSRPCGGKGVFESGSPIRIGYGSKVLCGESHYLSLLISIVTISTIKCKTSGCDKYNIYNKGISSIYVLQFKILDRFTNEIQDLISCHEHSMATPENFFVGWHQGAKCILERAKI